MTYQELMAAIARLRGDAAKLEPAIFKHAKTETEPVMHARLHRMGRVIGELRAVLETPVPLA